MSDDKFDVAILGSGITGSILAAILARNGVKTLLIEQGIHPRFAIGESTVPETTFLFRVLAARYGVPELANLSTFTKLRRHVSTSCGVKRNFTFAFHRQGETHRPTECSQLSTLSPPLGPDMHMFRQDVDAYLLALAASYGAKVRQQTDVVDIAIDTEVRLTTRRGELFRCAYVVDAGGVKSPLAERFGLRQVPSPLRTSSRSMYTHMIGVTPFDACTAPQHEHGLPSPLSQGTLHHIFQGGWLWVIPFDNHPLSTNRLCSVGLTLDPRHHAPSDLPPAEEFARFIARFPSIAHQFEHASPVRDWMRADRVQFSSSTAVGERYCLVPHAFAFVDPLFSTGLTMSMSAVNMLAWRLIHAKQDGDYSLARFTPIDTLVKANVAYVDRLVSRSYVAFGNFNLWNAWYRVWGLGTVYGSAGVLEALGKYMRTGDMAAFDACEQVPYHGAQASGLPEYRALFEAAAAHIDRVERGELDAEAAALEIFRTIDASHLWPPGWGALRPDVRHAGIFTIPKTGAFVGWVKQTAPACIRDNYFSQFGVGQVLALAGQDLLGEARADLGAFALLARDFVRGYNLDWMRPD